MRFHAATHRVLLIQGYERVHKLMFVDFILLQGYPSPRISLKPGYPFLVPLMPCLTLFFNDFNDIMCCMWISNNATPVPAEAVE